MTSGRRPLRAVAAAFAAAALTVACGSGDPPAPPSSSAGSTSASSASSSERPTTTTRTPTRTSDDDEPSGDLPGDLEPNVVEDECLLTTTEFESLSAIASVRAENTEIAGGGGRRSCFYAADGDEPAARVDVYRSASLTPQELVARIASNSAGARPLDGIASGAVVLPGANADGSAELVVATPTLLIVLTALPGGIPVEPADDMWAAAAAAMAAALPA